MKVYTDFWKTSGFNLGIEIYRQRTKALVLALHVLCFSMELTFIKKR